MGVTRVTKFTHTANVPRPFRDNGRRYGTGFSLNVPGEGGGDLRQVMPIIAGPPGLWLRNFCVFSGDKNERSSKAAARSRAVISLKLRLRHATESRAGTSPAHRRR